MKINEIEFTLKDGRMAVLRSPKDEDAEQLIAYLIKTAGETDFLLGYPEERGNLTVEQEIEIIQQNNESRGTIMMVCEVEGKIAGVCSIMFNKKLKERHRASVAIAQLMEFWNLGIGTKMFEEMIRIAELSGIYQLELKVIEGNVRARGLYEKMGFRLAGVHPNAICLKDGTMLDEYLMIRKMK